MTTIPVDTTDLTEPAAAIVTQWWTRDIGRTGHIPIDELVAVGVSHDRAWRLLANWCAAPHPDPNTGLPTTALCHEAPGHRGCHTWERMC